MYTTQVSGEQCKFMYKTKDFFFNHQMKTVHLINYVYKLI